MECYDFKPIAHVRSSSVQRYMAPRQAVFAAGEAWIEFEIDARLALAAADLEGFDRIWLLGVFHLNVGHDWKAKVRPPVSADGRRYGVLATRAPHRPNPLALSCVKLLEVTPRGLRVGGCDLLDGTPILDIKPYIPEADSFPRSAAGWRDELPKPFRVSFARGVREKAAAAQRQGAPDLVEFCRIQLANNPLDHRRKRIRRLAEGEYEIACRWWRCRFSLDEAKRTVRVLSIRDSRA